MGNHNVNENLKGLRLCLGISAEQWAKLVGVSPTLVYTTEAETSKVSDDYMDKIGIAFGVSKARLVYGPSNEFVDWLLGKKP